MWVVYFGTLKPDNIIIKNNKIFYNYLIIKKNNTSLNPIFINRLIFGWKELFDNKEIWSYNIQNDSVIQMLAKPLIIKFGENKN